MSAGGLGATREGRLALVLACAGAEDVAKLVGPQYGPPTEDARTDPVASYVAGSDDADAVCVGGTGDAQYLRMRDDDAEEGWTEAVWLPLPVCDYLERWHAGEATGGLRWEEVDGEFGTTTHVLYGADGREIGHVSQEWWHTADRIGGTGSFRKLADARRALEKAASRIEAVS